MPHVTMPVDDIYMRLAPATRTLLEEIKKDGGFVTDAEAIRAALALQHHLLRRMAGGMRVFLGVDADQIEREVALEGLR